MTRRLGRAWRQRRLGLVAALACALLAGCGLGPGEEREGEGAQLRVTRDFGQRQLGAVREDALREDQTVMRLLRSDFEVTTSAGGNFVESIEGVKGGGAEGRKDWFYWVNGVEADRGAAEYELAAGDRVQWDYRDWRATMRVPAIVGAFPEPLAGGWEGDRRPVRLECEQARSQACRTVEARLEAVDVPVSKSSLGAPYTETLIRVLVGRWPALRQSVSALERGPADSGVFATFATDRGSLELLDGAGEPVRRVQPGDGTGLVAALFPREEQLAWVVTGLDDRAVEAAAAALAPRALRNAFAVAATAANVEKLPLEEP